MKICKKIINIIVTLFAIVALFFFIVSMLLGIYNLGNIAGIIICLLLIFKFGFAKTYDKLKSTFAKNKFTKILWKIYSVTGIVFTSYAFIISLLMIVSSLTAPTDNATAIVLGAKVNPNGPSVALMDRIKAGERYIKSNPSASIIGTGGQGDDEPMSEGQCIYNYLSAFAPKTENVYKETKSTSTYENIKFAYEIIEEKNLDDNIAIATDSYHQLRAKIIAQKLGIKSKIGSINSIPDSSIGVAIYPTYFVREWFAIPVEILK